MKENIIADFSLLLKDIEKHLNANHQNVFLHAIHNGFRYTGVFILYLLGLFSLFFPLIANRVFPFQVLNKISNSENVILAIGSKPDAQAFVFGVYALFILLGILLFCLAIILQKSITRKNEIFNANKLLTISKEWFKKMEATNKDNNDYQLPKGATLELVTPKDFTFAEK
jgi:ABC-type multidrug transport system fused ATPase/permease subunit